MNLSWHGGLCGLIMRKKRDENRKNQFDSVFKDYDRNYAEKKREVYEMSCFNVESREKEILKIAQYQHPYENKALINDKESDPTDEFGVEAIDDRLDDYITCGVQGSNQKEGGDKYFFSEGLNSDVEIEKIENNDGKPYEIHNSPKPHQIIQDVVSHKNLESVSEATKMFANQSQEITLETKPEYVIQPIIPKELPPVKNSLVEPNIPQTPTKNHLTDAYKTFSFAKSKPVPVRQIDPLPKIPSTLIKHDKASMEYDFIINWYQTFQKQYLHPINNSLSSQDKKFRVEMKRIINMTVNAMSAHSALHLIDKWDKLRRLLAGQSVRLMGKDYNPLACSLPPQAATHYIEDCVASAIVGQGIKQVESNPKAAFFIAPIAVALASQFPNLQLVFMAHFYSKTALLVPLFEKNRAGNQLNLPQPMGAQMEEVNEVERLRTLKGTLQLYLAFLLTQVPVPFEKAVNHRNHGGRSNSSARPPTWFSNAGRLWTLTARCLNAIPQPDQLLGSGEDSIEAIRRLSSCLDVLVDVLTLGTSTLIKFYGPTQAGKLLASVWQIARAFSNLLDKGATGPVTLMAHMPSHTNMIISKLNIFLESCFYTRNRLNLTLIHDIPEPPGVLPPEFWGSC